MIDHSDYFYPLDGTCTLREDLLGFTDQPGFFNIGPRQGFPTGKVPGEFLMEDPILKKLFDLTNARRGLIFKMEPWTCYQWHQDHARGCAVNMLLTVESQSHTFLGKRIDNQHYRFTELVYEPDRLYLFDTGKEHTIFNREGIRFMFSVSFPLHQTYRSLMARCRDIGLVS